MRKDVALRTASCAVVPKLATVKPLSATFVVTLDVNDFTSSCVGTGTGVGVGADVVDVGLGAVAFVGVDVGADVVDVGLAAGADVGVCAAAVVGLGAVIVSCVAQLAPL